MHSLGNPKTPSDKKPKNLLKAGSLLMIAAALFISLFASFLTTSSQPAQAQNVRILCRSGSRITVLNRSCPAGGDFQVTDQTIVNACWNLQSDEGRRDCIGAVETCIEESSGSARSTCIQQAQRNITAEEEERSAQAAAEQGQGEEEEEEQESCEEAGQELAWAMCPLLTVTTGALEFLDSVIETFLVVPAGFLGEDFFEENEGFRNAWANIRNIAYIILVPTMLVMVVSTALGFEFLSAYTVKRALPRLVFAVIFIALSYDITVFLIEFFNVIGSSTQGLIAAPFGEDASALRLTNLFEGDSPFTFFFKIPRIIAFGIGALFLLWLFWSTLLLAALTGFVILMLRQIFIIALVLVAPLAILAWIFSEGTRYFKLWWSTFSKLLLMFPIIMGIITVGRVFAFIVLQPGEEYDGVVGALLAPLFGLAAYFLPYGAIPFAFRLAGGLFATITGIINDREKGLFDRAKNSRQEKLGRIPQGRALRGTNAVTRRLNTAMQRASLLPKIGWSGLVRPNAAVGRLRNAVDIKNTEMLGEADKSAAFNAIKNDDGQLNAGLLSRREDEIRASLIDSGYSGQNLEQSVAAIMRAQQDLGDNFEKAAIVAKAATGSGYSNIKTGHGEMLVDIMRASGDNRNMYATLIATAKSAAKASSRFDLAGAGVGANLEAIDKLKEGASLEDVTAELQDKSLALQGAGAVAGGRPESVKAFIRPLRRRLNKAYEEYVAAQQSGNQERIEGSSRILTQRIAETEALIDVAGQASPQAAEELANEIHSQTFDMRGLPDDVRDWLATNPDGTRRPSPSITVREAMDRFGTLGPYGEMRRNYSNQYAQQMAQATPGASPPTSGPAP